MLYLIITVSLGSVVMAGLSNNILAKFFFLAFAIMFGGMIGLKYMYFLSLESLKNEQKRQQLAQNNAKHGKKEAKTTKKYETRVVEDENYKQLIQVLKYFMQNKVLSHQQIVSFTEEINERLGDHVKYYKQNSFQNNLHEIYSKLKSKQLKSEDYLELTEILKSYNN